MRVMEPQLPRVLLAFLAVKLKLKFIKIIGLVAIVSPEIEPIEAINEVLAEKGLVTKKLKMEGKFSLCNSCVIMLRKGGIRIECSGIFSRIRVVQALTK